MALLNGILGGTDISTTNDISAAVGTNPQVGASLSDVDVAGLVGVGGLEVGFAAPTLIGVGVTNDLSSNTEDGGNGGLLGGIL